jgi:predicted permease
VRGEAGPFGKLLVSSQITLSLVLVAEAALFVQSLERIWSTDPGFRREGVLTMQLFQQAGPKIEDRTSYYHTLAEDLAQLSGVEQVSYSNQGPVTSYEYHQPVSVPSSPSRLIQAAADSVGPGFFHLMGMHLRSGREFDWHDDETAPPVAIVSESLAQRLFPGDSAIGQGISRPGRPMLRVVGVVNSASLWRLQSREPMAVYTPLLQESTFTNPIVDIRIQSNSATVMRAAEQTVSSLGRQFSIRTQTLDARMDRVFTNERLLVMVSTFFSGLALLLASLGLYGVMSHAIARQTPEIGVRMALGAQRRDVVAMVLREVAWMALWGIAAAIPLILATSRLVSATLYGIPARDPRTLALSALVLFGVALLAGYFPAHRAARIDPMAALRDE